MGNSSEENLISSEEQEISSEGASFSSEAKAGNSEIWPYSSGEKKFDSKEM